MRRWSRVLCTFLVMVLVISTTFSTGTPMSTATVAKAASKKKTKVLIAYFGRYGNTNFNKNVDATTSASIVKDGKKKRGTTEMLARLIQKETGGDLFRIQTKKKYPAGYNKVIDQNHEEMDEDYLPELKKKVKKMKQYDVVFIGYPIWAEDIPQAIKSFIKEHNLEGKTVIPFVHTGAPGRAVLIRRFENYAPDPIRCQAFHRGKIR